MCHTSNNTFVSSSFLIMYYVADSFLMYNLFGLYNIFPRQDFSIIFLALVTVAPPMPTFIFSGHFI